MVIADFLANELEIAQRLRDAVPALRKVECATKLDAVTRGAAREHTQTPKAYVEYIGSQVEAGEQTRSGDGDAQILNQGYLVLLVVRTPEGGAELRRLAGPLILQVFSALAGWSPSGPGRPLKLGGFDMPQYQDGCGFFPAIFYRQLLLVA